MFTINLYTHEHTHTYRAHSHRSMHTLGRPRRLCRTQICRKHYYMDICLFYVFVSSRCARPNGNNMFRCAGRPRRSGGLDSQYFRRPLAHCLMCVCVCVCGRAVGRWILTDTYVQIDEDENNGEDHLCYLSSMWKTFDCIQRPGNYTGSVQTEFCLLFKLGIFIEQIHCKTALLLGPYTHCNHVGFHRALCRPITIANNDHDKSRAMRLEASD